MDGVYAGAFAGVVTTVTMHPLDLIKVRLQVGSGTSFSGALKDLVTHKWTNAYRGLTPNLIGNATAWAAYFGCYDILKAAMFGPPLNMRESGSSLLGCAFTAGILSQLMTNPVWVIKTRILGSKPTDRLASPRIWQNVRDIYANAGLAGFWRGFWPGTLGTVQFAFYFSIYDPMKAWLKQNVQWPDTVVYFVSSAVAKVIAATTMYPHQVVRSRMQFNQMGLLEATKDVWRHEHWLGFYRGLSANLARVVPAMAITLISYEYAREWLDLRTEERAGKASGQPKSYND